MEADGKIDPARAQLIRDWMDAHGLQNESITNFIRWETYEKLRRLAADELKATATELGHYEPKDYEPQGIAMARTLWGNLRSFMRWEAFPKDYKEFLDACVVNGAAAGVIYFLFVLGLYGIAPARFVTWHGRTKRDRSDKEESERRREWNWDRGRKKF